MVIRTADPAATIQGISGVYTNIGKEQKSAPIVTWDFVRGAGQMNKQGADSLQKTLAPNKALGLEEMDQSSTTNFPEFMERCRRALPGGNNEFTAPIVFIFNIQALMEDKSAIQAIWNLRDDFKMNFRTMIGLCPSVNLPPELAQDVLILDEPLPTETELKAIAENLYQSSMPEGSTVTLDTDKLERIVDATLGLAAFPAEQSMAMSLKKDGMNIEELWERKRKMISQTKGLSVVSANQTFNDIGGVSNIKRYIDRIIKGAEPPRCFVFIDEGEKAFAGSTGGDSSGVSQGFLGTLLTDMQDNNYSGSLFVGFPGSAKSMVAKCAGATAGIPTIQFDLTGMKSSLVGSSEQNLRDSLAVVKAVSQGRAFFIMTSNGIATIPPELKRRFRAGIWFFDFPDQEERRVIWKIYLEKYKDKLQGLDLTLPEDNNWTGAEISVCVDNAYRMQCSLIEASAYIVPAYQSMGSTAVEKLRSEASDRYISASYPGPYQHNRAGNESQNNEDFPKPKGRVVNLS